MPTLQVVDFNIVCATLGGFLALYGCVSHVFKEKLYLAESLVSLVAGVIFSPPAANLVRPLEYALGDDITLETITLYFSRLVLGVQLVIAGLQLPARYLRAEWKSLAWLLGPGMAGMWIVGALLVWAFVPDLKFVYALVVAACFTPTDPVLSNTIVKGKFADAHIPVKLQNIIVAESGTNDGLGYPFLFLPLYLIRYTLFGNHSGGKATAMWFYEIWVYEIILGLVYGFVVGWIAKELLRWAEERKLVDRESYHGFAIALALFIIGTAGMFGSDDILACYIAGNAFNWDDRYRVRTEEDSLQSVMDMLLNVVIFIWYGAVAPWYEFAHNNVIPFYRLFFLGVLVLLLKRIPIIMALYKQVHQFVDWKRAVFVGFFGPMGVSAIFYLYVTMEYLRENVKDGEEVREDAARLMEILMVVVWFIVICSIVVHGIAVPIGKVLYRVSERLFKRKVSEDGAPIGEETDASAGPRKPGRSLLRQRTATDRCQSASKSASESASRGASPRPQTGGLALEDRLEKGLGAGGNGEEERKNGAAPAASPTPR